MAAMDILVVEDSATLRYSMERLIISMGHRPSFAVSGELALQILAMRPFDLIIMDVAMPGLDGFETTLLIREMLGDRWVPIIFITSFSDENYMLAGIEAGGDDYLIKPISENVLKAKLIAMQRIADMQHQLTKLNEQLAHLSNYDELTGLFNRRAFTNRAQQSLQENKRNRQPTSLLMIDVDHFKQYNDSYGHPAGDRCLQTIADCLRATLNRGSDIAARYGGEEFIVLLPCTEISAATAIANKLCKAVIHCHIEHKSSPVNKHVTISIGAAEFNGDLHSDLEKLILDADTRLYNAKHQGRNRVASDDLAAAKSAETDSPVVPLNIKKKKS